MRWGASNGKVVVRRKATATVTGRGGDAWEGAVATSTDSNYIIRPREKRTGSLAGNAVFPSANLRLGTTGVRRQLL